jgi:2-oxoglutarate ferredoxin oxidoreductase subunit alpha
MSVTSAAEQASEQSFKVIEQDEVVVRFAGDSGDGMQLAGTQMTNTSAIFGNEVSTMPDYPAEIRAPAGTVAGVSGYQLHFSSRPLRTPGDRLDALVAMNPAALEANIADLDKGGILIVNEDAFTKSNLKKAGVESNRLEDGSLKEYRVHRIPIEKLNAEACKDTGLTPRAAGRCKNFFALGVVYWLFDRPLEPTLRWIQEKFGTLPAVLDANTKALKAGYYFGETAEMFRSRYTIPKAKLPPGTYRKVSGNQATAIGLITAARLAGKPLFYGSYPITPASDILHDLSRYKNYDVRTFQAEDEIAAVTAVIGAAYAGAFAATGTSGPGVALKSEAIGLAVMTELPMVIINVQRGGPSTGLPTKTEQADLNQAVLGRNGEAPVCVLAAASPADCFATVLEAFRIAVRYMTPVILLSDGYLANGAEAWRIPSVDELPRFEIRHPKGGDKYQPYARNEDLSRPWALPGTLGLEHRIGGLEKKDVTGEVCYEPQNHQLMCELRRAKIRKIAETIPPLEVFGDSSGELLVVGWGSTYGSITSAVESCQARGMRVSSVHLRYLEPMPPDLGNILRRFKKVLVPELNLGQLLHRIRSEYLIDAIGLHKIQGKPFMVSEIENKIQEVVNGKDES